MITVQHNLLKWLTPFILYDNLFSRATMLPSIPYETNMMRGRVEREEGDILIAGFLRISSEVQSAKLLFLTTAGIHFYTTIGVMMSWL